MRARAMGPVIPASPYPTIPASVSILMRQLPAMRVICIALMSVILTLFRSAATSGLNRVNTPMVGSATARRNISRRVKVVIDDRLQHGRSSREMFGRPKVDSTTNSGELSRVLQKDRIAELVRPVSVLLECARDPVQPPLSDKRTQHVVVACS